jgi:hypothetical protein
MSSMPVRHSRARDDGVSFRDSGPIAIRLKQTIRELQKNEPWFPDSDSRKGPTAPEEFLTVNFRNSSGA